MDINCTSGCRHQKDGKCGLTNTPLISSTSFTGVQLSDDFSRPVSDCFYFEQKLSDFEKRSQARVGEALIDAIDTWGKGFALA